MFGGIVFRDFKFCHLITATVELFRPSEVIPVSHIILVYFYMRNDSAEGVVTAIDDDVSEYVRVMTVCGLC